MLLMEGPHFENHYLRPSEIICASHSVNTSPCWACVILVFDGTCLCRPGPLIITQALHLVLNWRAPDHRTAPGLLFCHGPESPAVLRWTGWNQRGEREEAYRPKVRAPSRLRQRWRWGKRKPGDHSKLVLVSAVTSILEGGRVLHGTEEANQTEKNVNAFTAMA